MRRILLVMDDCGAGDALRLTFCVDAVRRQFPSARVTMIAGEEAASVYGESASVDRVVVSRLYRRGRPIWRGRAVKALELCRLALRAGPRNDLVIVFWWGSSLLAMLARFSGRGARVGYSGRAGNFFTSALGAYDFDGDEVEQNQRLLAAAGVAGTPAPIPSIAVAAEADAAAEGTLRGTGWDGRTTLVLLHTGSDWACQQWRPERWSDLADRIADRTGAHIVFTGSASEKDQVAQIRSGMTRPSASIAGATSIAELAAVVRRAGLMVTVDSAAYVVARSQNVPVVVIAGPSHPERVSSTAEVLIVKRMTEPTARVIADCKRPRYPAGGCQEWSCPLAGLGNVSVSDVFAAAMATLRAGGPLAPRTDAQIAAV